MAEELITLDVWDKLLILAGVALLMVLVIITLMCVLSPYCCLFQYCPFRDKTPQGKSRYRKWPLKAYISYEFMVSLFSHWNLHRSLFYCILTPIFQILQFYNVQQLWNVLDGKPLMTYGSTDIMLEPRHSGRSRLGSLKEEESSEWSDASAKSSRDPRRVIQICFF